MKSYARAVPALLLLWPLACGGNTATQPGISSQEAAPKTAADTAAHRGLGWQAFSPPEGGFSILMPGTPTSETHTAPNGKTTRLVQVEVPDGAYMVAHVDMGTDRPRDASAVAQGLAKKYGGTVLAESEFTVSGTTGKEFELRVSQPRKGYLSARVVMANNELYQLLVLGTHAHVKDPDVHKFFESFRLTN
jgi:hypothetical protein